MPSKGRYYIPRRIRHGFLRFDGFHRLFVLAYESSSMKKLLPLFAALCLLFASCAGTGETVRENPADSPVPAGTGETVPKKPAESAISLREAIERSAKKIAAAPGKPSGDHCL
ncbi:hypothetical protein ACYULU_11740 [Breznakiellaceae bacterium SP9]